VELCTESWVVRCLARLDIFVPRLNRFCLYRFENKLLAQRVASIINYLKCTLAHTICCLAWAENMATMKNIIIFKMFSFLCFPTRTGECCIPVEISRGFSTVFFFTLEVDVHFLHVLVIVYREILGGVILLTNLVGMLYFGVSSYTT